MPDTPPAPDGPLTASERGWGVAVLVAALLSVAPALQGGFVHDDRGLIEDSPRIGDWSNFLEALGSDLFWLSGSVRPSPYWRPWVTATYFVDHALGDGAAWVFHLHNALLAVILAVLLWWLGGRRAAGAIGALLVLLHPAFVEPVANITARTDLYVAVAGVAALVCPKRWRLALLAVALGCKETAILIPALWVLQSLAGGWRKAWRDSRAGWALVAGWLVARGLLVGGRATGPPWDGWGGLPARLGTALWRIVAPGSGPRPDVDLSHLPDMGAALGLLVAAAVVGGIGWLAWRGRTWLAVGLGTVLFPLLLTAGLAGPGIRMADGLLAWSIAGAGLLLLQLPSRAVVVLAPLVGLLAVGHVQRMAVWRSPETLWSAALSATPDDPRVQLKAARVVLAEAPSRARTLAGGILAHPDPRLRREGHEVIARAWLLEPVLSAEGARDLRAALRHAADPTDREAGWACAARCVWDDAPTVSPTPDRVAVCRAAVDRGEATGDVWNTIGMLAAEAGSLDAARDAFATALELEPGRAAFRTNLELADRLLAEAGHPRD